MLTSLLVLASCALAQFPPTPEGVTILKSKYHEGVTISYKEPNICETTPGVKSYSGYVHLPPGLLADINGEDQDYPINTYFHFFESRKDPINAPLSIWLNGGPGASSLMGLYSEMGPCFIGADSNSTVLNEWAWNNEVNMLFIDQPSQVGFSYDVPTNGTKDAREQTITPMDFADGIPVHNYSTLVGTFSSQNNNSTANSTIHAAHALWHLAQTFFFEFPYYKPHDDRISLWAESYGGRYGPAIFDFFQLQNERIENGTITEKGTKLIHLDTLGIVNGLLDSRVQMVAKIMMAHNNTYGIQIYNESTYSNAMSALEKPGGCLDQLLDCQKQAAERDPLGTGGDLVSNAVCSRADDYCGFHIVEPYLNFSGRGWYDIAAPKADPFPKPYHFGFLSQAWVQQALGVPVNFTSTSNAVYENFRTGGDMSRAGSLESVAYLLDHGVKVHMMYGDRDFACNWFGGELASLAIDYSGTESFAKAGYLPILTGNGIGGMVRQYGNFSFSRVFQAGHEVPAYQPEVAYNIFQRALFNRDISTGVLPVWDEYSTTGPLDTWHIKNVPPKMSESRCYVLAPESCTEEQWAKVVDGSALVKDYFVVEDDADSVRHNFVGVADQRVLDGGR